eukprot:scaffold2737_cov99-Cylindrotheca_fusiformis.AAC.9
MSGNRDPITLTENPLGRIQCETTTPRNASSIRSAIGLDNFSSQHGGHKWVLKFLHSKMTGGGSIV